MKKMMMMLLMATVALTAISLTKVNKNEGITSDKQRSDLVQFTIGYKFEL